MDTIVALHCYGFNMCCPDAYEAVADLTLENRLLKKSMIGDGDERG